MKLENFDITLENIDYQNTKIIYEIEFNDKIGFIKYNRDLIIKQLLN